MGCGVVEFETPEEAQNAVHSLNETELDGRIIKCREDRFIEEGEDNIYEVNNNLFFRVLISYFHIEGSLVLEFTIIIINITVLGRSKRFCPCCSSGLAYSSCARH